jgi:hypothetical protein
MATKFDDNIEGGATLTLDDNDEPIIIKQEATQSMMFPEIEETTIEEKA